MINGSFFNYLFTSFPDLHTPSMMLVPSLLTFSPFLLVLILSGFTSGQDVEEMETVDEDEYTPLGAHQIASQSLNIVNDYLGKRDLFLILTFFLLI